MPSLRRTLSSPSVRSSPYSNGLLVARGSGYRRSSGSETTNRRVLADIEWWKVTDGQCDADSDQEPEDRNRGDPDIDVSLVLGIPITHADNGVEHPLPSISAFTASSIEVYISSRTLCSKVGLLTLFVLFSIPQNSSPLCQSPPTRRHTGITALNLRPPLYSQHLSQLTLPLRVLASGYWTLAWALPKSPSLLSSLTNPVALSSPVHSHSPTVCSWMVKQISTLTLPSRLFPPPPTSSTEQECQRSDHFLRLKLWRLRFICATFHLLIAALHQILQLSNMSSSLSASVILPIGRQKTTHFFSKSNSQPLAFNSFLSSVLFFLHDFTRHSSKTIVHFFTSSTACRQGLLRVNPHLHL